MAVKPRGRLGTNLAEAAIEYIQRFECPEDKVVVPYVVARKLSEGHTRHNLINKVFSQDPVSKLTRKKVVMLPFLQLWGESEKDKEGHWYTVSVNSNQWKFEILDSLRGPDDEELRLHSGEMVLNIKRAWREHYADAKMQIQDFTTEHISVPMQDNIDDCGFYMLEFLKKWDGRVVPAFGPDEIVETRKIITHRLITNQDFNEKKNAKKFIEQHSK